MQPIARSVVDFTWLMFQTNLRNFQGLLVSLGTPVAIMLVYLMGGSPLSPLMVPLLFVLSVTFTGSPLGARMLIWREQHIFRRLSVTSTPIPYLIVGLFVAQLATSLAQSLVLLLLVLLAGISFTTGQFAVYLLAILLACLCFTAFGPMLATFVTRPEVYAYAYLLTAMPVAFLSVFGTQAIFHPVIGSIVSILPTTLFSNLLQIINTPLQLSTALFSSAGLLLYAGAFLWIASRRATRFLP